MNKKVHISVVGERDCDWLMLAADTLARLRRLLGDEVSFFAPDNEFQQVFKISAQKRSPLGRDQISALITLLQQSGAVYSKTAQCRICAQCGQPLEEAICPDCDGAAVKAERACYYLRQSRQGQKVAEMLQSDLILPSARRNDLLNNMANRTSEDVLLAVTEAREGKNILPLPWFRILAENLIGSGYPLDEGAFSRLWAQTYIFVPREFLDYIIFWCGTLAALGLPAPRAMVCHYCMQILDRKGEEVSPLLLAKNYGYQGLRYFMLGARALSGESSYSEDQVIQSINHDLANELGNLVSRAISLVSRFGEGMIPPPDILTRRTGDLDLRETALDLPDKVKSHIENQEMYQAVRFIKNLVGKANRYIESSAPWQLAGSPDQQGRLNTVLYNLCEALRFLAVALKPLLPEAAQDILHQLGIDGIPEITAWNALGQWGLLPIGVKISEKPALFPRILPGYGGIGPQPDLIMREELARIKMVAARVVSAEVVPDYPSLFQLILYDGHQRIRVLAPVAHTYTPSSLSGKKVVLIANLRPVETDDLYSEGEVLVAESETGGKVLVFVDDDIPEGSKIQCLT